MQPRAEHVPEIWAGMDLERAASKHMEMKFKQCGMPEEGRAAQGGALRVKTFTQSHKISFEMILF